MSSHTLAVKVQNSESLQASCSWKGNICLSILKYSWQWDFNTVQRHTLKQSSKTSHQACLTSSHNSLGLRKQPTFCKATTGSPVKWCLRTKRKSSILMTCHYPDWVVLLIGWSVSVINQKHYPDLGSDISSVWNFFNSCSSDVILWGNKRWRCEMLACFLRLQNY